MKKRNIQKRFDEFTKLKARKGGSFGDLYASEIYTLWKTCGGYEDLDIYRLTGRAFIFGFMEGYKAAKKEASQEAKKKTSGSRAKSPEALQ